MCERGRRTAARAISKQNTPRRQADSETYWTLKATRDTQGYGAAAPNSKTNQQPLSSSCSCGAGRDTSTRETAMADVLAGCPSGRGGSAANRSRPSCRRSPSSAVRLLGLAVDASSHLSCVSDSHLQPYLVRSTAPARGRSRCPHATDHAGAAAAAAAATAAAHDAACIALERAA